MFTDPNRKVLGGIKSGIGLFSFGFVKILKRVSDLVSRVSYRVDNMDIVVVLSRLRVEDELGAHPVDVDRGATSAWSRTRAVG